MYQLSLDYIIQRVRRYTYFVYAPLCTYVRMNVFMYVCMYVCVCVCIYTYSMVQSPSWEANWFAASQDIPRISRNPKVHYRSQPNPVHIPTSHLLEIHPNIFHPSTPRSPQWSPSLRFPQQVCVYIHTHTHCVHTHVSICTYICMNWVCVCVCVCVYIYIYIYIYTYTHSYIHRCIYIYVYVHSEPFL